MIDVFLGNTDTFDANHNKFINRNGFTKGDPGIQQKAQESIQECFAPHTEVGDGYDGPEAKERETSQNEVSKALLKRDELMILFITQVSKHNGKIRVNTADERGQRCTQMDVSDETYGFVKDGILYVNKVALDEVKNSATQPGEYFAFLRKFVLHERAHGAFERLTAGASDQQIEMIGGILWTVGGDINTINEQFAQLAEKLSHNDQSVRDDALQRINAVCELMGYPALDHPADLISFASAPGVRNTDLAAAAMAKRKEVSHTKQGPKDFGFNANLTKKFVDEGETVLIYDLSPENNADLEGLQAMYRDNFVNRTAQTRPPIISSITQSDGTVTYQLQLFVNPTQIQRTSPMSLEQQQQQLAGQISDIWGKAPILNQSMLVTPGHMPERSSSPSNTEWRKEILDFSRMQGVKKFLTDNKYISSPDDFTLYIGENTPGTMRQFSYLAVTIPQHNKVILVYPGTDNATFVIDVDVSMLDDTDVMTKLYETNKDDLQDVYGARRVTWHADEKVFGAKLQQAWALNEESVSDGTNETGSWVSGDIAPQEMQAETTELSPKEKEAIKKASSYYELYQKNPTITVTRTKTENKQKVEFTEEMSFRDAIAGGGLIYADFARGRNKDKNNVQIRGKLESSCNQLFAWSGQIGGKFTGSLVKSADRAQIVLEQFGENVSSGRQDPRLTESEIKACLKLETENEIKEAKALYSMRSKGTQTVQVKGKDMTLADAIAGGVSTYSDFASGRNADNGIQMSVTLPGFCNLLFGCSGQIGGRKASGLVQSPDLAQIVMEKFGENISSGRSDPRLTKAEIEACLQLQTENKIKEAKSLYSMRSNEEQAVQVRGNDMTLAHAIAGGYQTYTEFARGRNADKNNVQIHGKLPGFCNQLFAWSGTIGGKITGSLVLSADLAQIVLEQFGENVSSGRLDPRLTKAEIKACLQLQTENKIKEAKSLYSMRSKGTQTVQVKGEDMTLADAIAGGVGTYIEFARGRNADKNNVQIRGKLPSFCNQLFAGSGKIGGKFTGSLVTSADLAQIVMEKFGENISSGRLDPRLTKAEIKACLQLQTENKIKEAKALYSMLSKGTQTVQVKGKDMTLADAIAGGVGTYIDFARGRNADNGIQIRGELPSFCNQLFAWSGKIGGKFTGSLVLSADLAQIVLEQFGENVSSGRQDPRLTESEIKACRDRYQNQSDE